MERKLTELTQKASQCLKNEQDIKALHDAVKDMEPSEACIMLADYLQQQGDEEFWRNLNQKAQVDRHISRWYRERGVNHAKIKR